MEYYYIINYIFY